VESLFHRDLRCHWRQRRKQRQKREKRNRGNRSIRCGAIVEGVGRRAPERPPGPSLLASRPKLAVLLLRTVAIWKSSKVRFDRLRVLKWAPLAAQGFADRATILVGLGIPHELAAGERIVLTGDLVPHRDVWCDLLLLDHAVKHRRRAICGIAGKPRGFQTEQAIEASPAIDALGKVVFSDPSINGPEQTKLLVEGIAFKDGEAVEDNRPDQ
jgi:hypothetical protein